MRKNLATAAFVISVCFVVNINCGGGNTATVTDLPEVSDVLTSDSEVNQNDTGVITQNDSGTNINDSNSDSGSGSDSGQVLDSDTSGDSIINDAASLCGSQMMTQTDYGPDTGSTFTFSYCPQSYDTGITGGRGQQSESCLVFEIESICYSNTLLGADAGYLTTQDQCVQAHLNAIDENILTPKPIAEITSWADYICYIVSYKYPGDPKCSQNINTIITQSPITGYPISQCGLSN
jgi:hypothetical protein